MKVKVKKADKKAKGDEKPDKKSDKLKKKAKKKGKPSKDDEDEDEKPAKKKAASSAGVEKDAFGTRKGTRTARINSVLIKASKPLSTAQIEEKADAISIHSHLSKLMADGLLEKVNDGKYELTKKGRKTAGK